MLLINSHLMKILADRDLLLSVRFGKPILETTF